MSTHIFVDETKRNGYLLVAGVVLHGDLAAARKVIRGLVLPGQRRLHMKNESDSRKRAIASAIVELSVQVTVYDAGKRYRNEQERRSACLRSLVGDAAARSASMIVLEQDDTLVVGDRKLLYRAVRDADCPDLRYEHRRATAEQLLAIPDAVAWCWAKGGDWRRRVESVVVDVRDV